MGAANGNQPAQRYHQAQPMPQARGLAQQEGGQQQRDEGLRLQHHRGHAGRHAQLQAQEQHAELAHALHQPIGGQIAPAHRLGRAHEQQKGQRRHHEAQRAQQHGRQRQQAELHGHEVGAPDQDDQQRTRPVATAQVLRGHALPSVQRGLQWSGTAAGSTGKEQEEGMAGNGQKEKGRITSAPGVCTTAARALPGGRGSTLGFSPPRSRWDRGHAGAPARRPWPA